jgi:protein SCO1
MIRRISRSILVSTLSVLALSVPSYSIAAERAQLPRIGPAADFNLATVEGGRLSLRELRGKVVVLTFIYATCADTCPILTAKLVGLKRRLSSHLNSQMMFVAITVDPNRDTPVVLKRFAQKHSAIGPGWSFLTGAPAQISQVASEYGVFQAKQTNGDVQHSFLTSMIDQTGNLRVQYMGIRFDAEEFLTDLKSLLREPETQ